MRSGRSSLWTREEWLLEFLDSSQFRSVTTPAELLRAVVPGLWEALREISSAAREGGVVWSAPPRAALVAEFQDEIYLRVLATIRHELMMVCEEREGEEDHQSLAELLYVVDRLYRRSRMGSPKESAGKLGRSRGWL